MAQCNKMSPGEAQTVQKKVITSSPNATRKICNCGPTGKAHFRTVECTA